MKKNENYKLMPELNSNWGANVRNLLPPKRWDEIRRESYKRAGYKCEICGENGLDQGFKHPVECHEVWSWNRSSNIQKLLEWHFDVFGLIEKGLAIEKTN